MEYLNAMKKIAYNVLFLLLLCGHSSHATELTEEMKIRVLIVDGFSHHDWQATTQLIR